MSRPIKFRAWETAKNKWMPTDDGEYYYIPLPKMMDNSVIIEQYTGLKDEDGKEIYEGDIVTLNCYWEEVSPEDCFEIKFEDGCFRVGDGFENEAGKYLKEYRLVGNIHENPELLGGEE